MKFEEIIDSIVNDQPDQKAASAAAERVRRNLFAAAGAAQVAGRIQSCDDYCGLIPAYMQRTLSDSRRMLLDDHIRECILCRKALDAARTGGKPKVHVMTPARRPFEYSKWAVAAALLVTAGSITWYTLKPGSAGEAVATVDSIDGVLYQVSGNGSLPIGAGRQLIEGEEIRAGRGSHAMVRLFDGSLIEMNERADLSFSREFRGTTIKLERGNIIVQAAKQKRGKLFVASGESTVSVKGTIFAVNRGTKGTRVSVVEGSVQVDQAAKSDLLKPGDQTTSDPMLTKVPVQTEVAWSRDSARYIALLGELSDLQKKLSAIPSPALRYQSNLLKYVPADATVYASIPNIGEQLREARRVFEEQTRTNPVLGQWWNGQQKGGAELLDGLDRLQSLATYIGDEAVLIVRPNHSFTMLAEAKSAGLDQFLERELKGALKVSWKVHNGKTLIFSSDPASLQTQAAVIDAGGTSPTKFRQRIAKAYESGAGWLLCLDAKQLGIGGGGQDAMDVDLGVDNVEFLVFERRDISSHTENTASINFGTQRRGVASWLGEPSPLTSLDFVSPDAGAAMAFVMKNPRQAVEEVLAGIRRRNPQVDQEVARIEADLGLKIVDDIAGPIGSEMTIAQDGPLLPDLGWKFVVEVNAPQTLQHSIETLATRLTQVKLVNSVVNGRTYYQLSGPAFPMSVFYTYSDGYLVAAPSQSQVAQAIDNRHRGNTLARSEKFRSQLPLNASANFSALVYHNISQVTGPVAEQLEKLNVITEEQRRSAGKLDDMTPGLIYVYGEANRISISSSGGFFGMDLGVLAGLDRGLPFLIPKGLFPTSK